MCLEDRGYIYKNSVLEGFEMGLVDGSARFQFVQPSFFQYFSEIIRCSSYHYQ